MYWESNGGYVWVTSGSSVRSSYYRVVENRRRCQSHQGTLNVVHLPNEHIHSEHYYIVRVHVHRHFVYKPSHPPFFLFCMPPPAQIFTPSPRTCDCSSSTRWKASSLRRRSCCSLFLALSTCFLALSDCRYCMRLVRSWSSVRRRSFASLSSSSSICGKAVRERRRVRSNYIENSRAMAERCKLNSVNVGSYHSVNVGAARFLQLLHLQSFLLLVVRMLHLTLHLQENIDSGYNL